MLATMAELRGGLDGLRATHTFERVELEVGCGDGGFLDFLAGANPTTLYLGFEKDLVWAGKAARRVAGLPNARVWCADIRAVFEGIAGLGRAQALWMNCPDPWPKDRHAARRLSAEDYVDWLARILLQGGHFHLATDVESYHRELTELFQARANHWNLLTPAPRAAISYRTKFETRWRAEGRTMYHLGAELADPVPTDALARYDNAYIAAQLAALPPTMPKHDQELARGTRVARTIRPRGKPNALTVAVGHTELPVHIVARLELDAHGWSWTNQQDWLLLRDDVDCLFELLRSAPVDTSWVSDA